MRIQFWGTRGSIPKPGHATARYGGNTSCVEIRTGGRTLIVVDCGTGAHGLGQELVGDEGRAVNGHILISHTHWDHIHGIPFFAPLFAAGNHWDIYGPKGLSGSIREALSGQMQYTYFPVTLEQFAADVRYHDLVEGSFRIEDAVITARYLNHPALTLGYRIRVDGASVVYCCDHEPTSPELATGKVDLADRERRYTDFIAGADLVIHDAQYTAQEYPAKIGWGHSSIEYAVRLCQDAGVKRLAVTHHDPLRNDAALDRILEDMRAQVGRSGSTLELIGAAEGEAIELADQPAGASPKMPDRFPAHSAIDVDAERRPILLFVPDNEMRETLSAAIAFEHLTCEVARSSDDLISRMRATEPSLVIVQHMPGGADGIDIARSLRRVESGRKASAPIVIVTAREELADRRSDVPTEWMVKPFSLSYARTKVRAWVLRSASRWVRAQLPEDEARRLATLRELAILDTEPDARLDRITRIAASVFDVPIALVSLVDSDRQWFKSRFGLDAGETSRDMAFCSHVVYQKSDLIVPDALQDNRFADNPLVLQPPRVRFYAGAPLIVQDGSCIGTLCLIDHRPRDLTAAQLEMFHDIRDLALEEIRRVGSEHMNAASLAR